MQPARHILPIIVFAQFCCTSLWFASNAVIFDLGATFGLADSALGHLTAAVQFGFIIGTLVFAILSIADRFSPSKVFFTCALLGALFNMLITFGDHGLISLVSLRALTGFFLAGIYPVGMKIAADYFDKGLGKSLGFLVSALVLGTAFPHLIKTVGANLPWKMVLYTTSAIALLGGLLIVLFVPDGPFRKSAPGIQLSAIKDVFKVKAFRSAAFGYFGHMWELYAFWAFTPIMLASYNEIHSTAISVPLWSFIIIGIGSLSCIVGGYLSQSYGPKRIASIALTISGLCCLLSFFVFGFSPNLFLGFLLIWGITVIMDSPLFSTLVAQNADAQIKGTALTIVNCIGFSITIISIQLLNYLMTDIPVRYLFMALAVGPIFGVLSLLEIRRRW